VRLVEGDGYYIKTSATNNLQQGDIYGLLYWAAYISASDSKRDDFDFLLAYEL
jgi:hypothetical protein